MFRVFLLVFFASCLWRGERPRIRHLYRISSQFLVSQILSFSGELFIPLMLLGLLTERLARVKKITFHFPFPAGLNYLRMSFPKLFPFACPLTSPKAVYETFCRVFLHSSSVDPNAKPDNPSSLFPASDCKTHDFPLLGSTRSAVSSGLSIDWHPNYLRLLTFGNFVL